VKITEVTWQMHHTDYLIPKVGLGLLNLIKILKGKGNQFS